MTYKNGTDYEEAIVRRLNIVITLLIELTKGDQSVRDKIKMLSDLGLDYKEIASILGKDKNHIAVELNTIKKKTKKTKEALAENA